MTARQHEIDPAPELSTTRPVDAAPVWIDTHCHLDAAEFDPDRDAVAAEARQRGLVRIVIPAVEVHNFGTVAELAARIPGGAYALGIHPLCTPRSSDADVATLRDAIRVALDDPRFVAIGEIGLDFFVAELTLPEARARQEWFYAEQLKLAREFDLPLLLHVRRSQDVLLKHLRRASGAGWKAGGIAHAFNGSRQQAEAFIALGFALGFGGTLTYDRSLRIRQRAAEAPDDAIVLETDSPDIPPVWLSRSGGAHGSGDRKSARNAPCELPRIAQSLADLRGWTLEKTAAITTRNAYAALPRLALSRASGSADESAR
jgi:TatD DNase family protein